MGKYSNLIFIHINKTGGTSIKQALGLPNYPHWTAQERLSQNKFKRIWDKSFKFSFVRNPWDRMISQYFSMLKIKALGKIGFSDWIHAAYSGKQGFPAVLRHKIIKKNTYIPQIDWLTDDEGKLLVDFVGKFENIEKDFNIMLEMAEISENVVLYKENVGEHEHYTHYYDGPTKKAIERVFKKDIEYFGYKYGE